MIYTISFEMSDCRTVENDYVTRAESPLEVEYEITKEDEYVVSNSRKHVRIRRAGINALIIELKEGQ